jgi:hypothetical protein
VVLDRSPSSDQTLAAIASLYDAAFDQALWPKALAQLTSLTDSQASTFWLLDAGSRSLHPTFVSINFDQRVVDHYVGGIASLDPTVRYLLAHPKADIVHDGMLGPGQDDDTRRYMDWHVRNVETRYRLVAQSELGPSIQAGVALHRAERADLTVRRSTGSGSSTNICAARSRSARSWAHSRPNNSSRSIC